MPNKPYDEDMKEMPTNEKELSRAMANLLEDFGFAHPELVTEEMRDLFCQLTKKAVEG